MKTRCPVLCLALLFPLGTALAASQDQQQPQQSPPPPSLSKPSEQKPPTLGEAPSLAGPHAANTTSPRRLTQIHSVFIEPMDNGLGDKLIEQIGTNGPFRIAADRRGADAVMRGTCFDSARLKTVHSEVFLTGRGGESIWQDIIRQPYKPPPLNRAVASTAEAIAQDLASSVRNAQAQ